MFENIFGKKTGSSSLAIRVTARGFEPARIRIPHDRATTLVVTREIERTCAREFVLDELGIHRSLPLNEAVEITLHPKEPGALQFGCAMGKMIGGVVEVV